MALLERHDVRADIADHVLIHRGLLSHEEVVLAEDPGRQPGQDGTELRCGAPT